MNTDDFSEFFSNIHGFDPFPWQKRLVETVESKGWPETINLPTSAGKTSVIDVAIFSMALRSISGRAWPRRVFLTVDRRFVVDEAYTTSMKIKQKLYESLKADGIVGDIARTLASQSGEGSPLEVIRLHGGIPHEPTFIDNPLQPTVVLTTVDQVGSRLLFRGYGISEYMRPIHAALVAKDSLIILDEAHLSRPFLKTLGFIKKYEGEKWSDRSVGGSLQIVSMSATHPAPSGDVFQLDQEDMANPVLSARLTAKKPVKLIEEKFDPGAKDDKNLEKFAETFAVHGSKAVETGGKNHIVAIVVNVVSLANRIYADLSHRSEFETVKITGRIRPFERDIILENVLPRMAAGRSDDPEKKPLIVVATQTIEVGANLDFDVMISESAPLDALQQRFGRLNRLGRNDQSWGMIIHLPGREENNYIYGDAWKKTWKFLNTNKQKGIVDFGPNSISDLIRNKDTSDFITASNDSPILMPSHLDSLVQTSPEPYFEPDIPLLLHGKSDSQANVQVIWRSDLPENMDAFSEDDLNDIVSLIPPNSYESVEIPIGGIKSFLRGKISEFSDIEGSASDSNSESEGDGTLKVFLWKGMQGGKLVSGAEVKPGQTIVMPSFYGGYDEYGWNPECKDKVKDIAEIAAKKVYNRDVFRIHPGVVAVWFDENAPESVEKCREIIRTAINNFSEGDDLQDVVDVALSQILDLDGIKASVSTEMRKWISMGRKRKDRVYPSGNPQGILLQSRRVSSKELSDDDDSSSYIKNVDLETHSSGVEKYARKFATSLLLPEDIVECVSAAGLFHDTGKADPRFQSWLRGGELWEASEPFLAKSSGSGNGDLRAIIMARDAAGYPKGGRHELYSCSLLESNRGLMANHISDFDLVLYLVGSHHGRGRAMMPVIEDDGTSISLEFFGKKLVFSGRPELENIGSYWPQLFWKLVRKYGYWGLAYLEMILRLADHRESEREATENDE